MRPLWIRLSYLAYLIWDCTLTIVWIDSSLIKCCCLLVLAQLSKKFTSDHQSLIPFYIRPYVLNWVQNHNIYLIRYLNPVMQRPFWPHVSLILECAITMNRLELLVECCRKKSWNYLYFIRAKFRKFRQKMIILVLIFY